MTLGRRDYLYPSFQFERGKTLAHLEDILGILRQHDPWEQLGFFVSSSSFLDDATPLEALREGRAEDVRKAASLYLEQGVA